MKKYNFIFVFLLYTICGIFMYLTNALKDQEAKVVPYAIAIITIVLATILLIKMILSKKDEKISNEGIGRVAVMSAIILGYMILMRVVGFYIATIVYLVCSMMALGQKNKKAIILVTIFTTLALYVFFDLLFKMAIPEGLIAPLLFN